MKRKSENSPVNTTEKNLKGLPFKKSADLKKEENEIRKNVWRRFEEAKAIEEYSNRDEYGFWKKRFKKGTVCSYGEDDTELVKVFADDDGIVRIHINEKNGREVPPDDLLESLVRAVTSSFNEIYAKASGLIPIAPSNGFEIKKNEQKNKK